MIKLNWGWGIAIFYSLFVIVMVTAVVKSSMMGVDLVQEQYYDADLAYESFRQSRVNTENLESRPSIKVYSKDNYISIDFMNNWQEIDGTVQMYRPSDGGADKVYSIQLKDGKMQVPTGDLISGRWKIKMTWKGDGTDYYMEDSVVI